VNSTIHRLRRWTVTAIAATTLLSTGVILATAGPASAAPTDIGSIVGVTQPEIATSTSGPVDNQGAGNLVLTINGPVTLHDGDEIHITTSSNTSGDNINWAKVPTFTTTAGASSAQPCVGNSPSTGTAPTCPFTPAVTPFISGPTLTFQIGAANGAANGDAYVIAASDSISFTLSNVQLNVPTSTPVGPDFNSAIINEGTNASGDAFALEPGENVPHTFGGAADASTNAVVGTSASAPTMTLKAVSTPPLAIGGSDQTGGNWNMFLVSGPAGTSFISAGDSVHIVVADDAGNNCHPGTLANPDTIGFASTPTINITAGVGAANGVPTATVSTSAVNDGPDIHCAGTSIQNELTITFTNTVTLESPTIGINIQILGVKYNVSSGATITADSAGDGDLAVASIYDLSGFSTLPTAFSTTPALVTPLIGGPSNGDIVAVTVAGNNPPSDIQLNVTSAAGSGSEAVDQPISPITLTESATGALPSGANGYVCVTLFGSAWNASTIPTATATNGATVGPVAIYTTGPFAGDSELEFQVTGGSTTGPAVITLSNLAVDVPQSILQDLIGGFVAVTYGGTNSACLGGATTTYPTKAFTVSARIYGVDADGTAAQAFGIANPVTAVGTSFTSPGAGGNDYAVLATDSDPYDALSASYLAGQTGTGILLTPTSTLSTETLTALRLAGVETVYAVGGPDAISQADITQLEGTPSYYPGGTTERYDPFTNDLRDIQVQWIYGATADDTASQVAQFVGNFPIGNPAYQAGYGGMYNDTTGSSGSPESTAPDTGVQTAIIATDTGFQDAASASVMAYHNHLPLILSPPAALSTGSIAALDNDGIQQAIVMGGPDVINDSVITQLEGMGISVMRIAGSDYTDTSAEAAKFELSNAASNGQFDGLAYSLGGAIGLASFLPLEFNATALSFARGDFYTDAIVSSQINSLFEMPELLTENPTTLGTPVATFLATEGNPDTAYGTDVVTPGIGPLPGGFSNDLYMFQAGEAIFGGPVAFSSAVETTIAQDLGPDQLPLP
jgi:hypothetical protein